MHGKEEKLPETDIVPEGSFISKIGNFWFYNKWKVLIAIAALLVIGVCCFQTCRNAEDDAVILYAGSYYPATGTYSGMKKAFSSVLPTDYNEDGEKIVDVASCYIFSDEQAEALKAALANGENVVLVNSYTNQKELQNFDNLILAGEYSVVIAEPWLYRRVAKSGGFRELSDVLGYVPENAFDAYSVRFKDTDFAKAHEEEFAGLTDDTLIAFRTQSQIGNLTGRKKNDAVYAVSEELFRAILDYKS